MTAKRRAIFAEYQDAARRGERISLAELARRCGLYDYRDARRTIRDLRRIGRIGG